VRTDGKMEKLKNEKCKNQKVSNIYRVFANPFNGIGFNTLPPYSAAAGKQ